MLASTLTAVSAYLCIICEKKISHWRNILGFKQCYSKHTCVKSSFFFFVGHLYCQSIIAIDIKICVLVWEKFRKDTKCVINSLRRSAGKISILFNMAITSYF